MLTTFSCSDTLPLLPYPCPEHIQVYVQYLRVVSDTHERKNDHFEAKTQKRRRTRRGTPPQRQKTFALYPSTHPHNPHSNTFRHICSAFLPASWLSHTMVPKTQHLPSPARETDKERKRVEGTFFPSQKESNHSFFGSFLDKFFI